VPIVLKSGNLNLLEPPGPVKACNGIALALHVEVKTLVIMKSVPILLPVPNTLNVINLKYYIQFTNY
jgi:hypothetical protein